MQNHYRIGFRTIFLVALSHLLVLGFFFWAKAPFHPAHKPLVVKSFSADHSFSQDQKPAAKPFIAVRPKPPEDPVLDSPKEQTKPGEKLVDAPKEVPKKEKLAKVVEKKETTPSLQKTVLEPSWKKNAALQKKSSQEKIHRAGEKPKMVQKQEKKTEEKTLLQTEYAQSLVKALEKNIAAFHEHAVAKTKAPEISVPSFLKSSSIEATVEDSPFGLSGSSQYIDLLIQDLKNNLKLPEYGEIKLRMRISAKGEVLKVDVLFSKSEKNKLYLQKELLRCQFLWFSSVLSGAPFYDFVVTFQNENF